MSTIPPSNLDSFILDPLEIPALFHRPIQEAVGQEIGADIPVSLQEELRAAGAFSLMRPGGSGRPEARLTTSLHAGEAFGRLDARTAWAVWKENFNWIFYLLDKKGAAHMRGGGTNSTPAGPGISATAFQVEGGYQVTGHWKADGAAEGVADETDWLVVLAALTGEVDAHTGETATARVRGFVLHKKQFLSNHSGITADKAFVPAGLAADMNAPAPIDRAFYQEFMPAFAFSGCTAVALGVAYSALAQMTSTVEEMAASADSAAAELLSIRSALASSEVALRETRHELHAAAGGLDADAEQHRSPTDQHRESLRTAVARTAQVSRQVLMLMYELAISYTPFEGDNPLERLVHGNIPALQHAQHAAAFLGVAGHVRLGIEAA